MESVKKESTLLILKELCHNSYLSKNELSRRCGLGISTVAKILNFLKQNGIVSSLYANAEDSLRPITVYGIKSSYYVTSYDISSSFFRSYLYRPARYMKLTAEHRYDHDLYFEDNFYKFRRKAKSAEEGLSRRKLSGSLILLPGTPDAGFTKLCDPLFSDTNILRPSEMVNALSETENIIYDDKRYFRASYIRENLLNDGQTALAVFLDRTRFSSCIVFKGSDSAVISDIGTQYTVGGYPLIDYIKSSPDAEHFITSIVSVLKKLHSAFSFTNILICGDYVRNMDTLTDMIRRELSERLPSVSMMPFVSDEKMINFKSKELLCSHLTNIIFSNRLTI